MQNKIDKEFIQKLEIGRLINFDSYVEGFEIDSRRVKSQMGFVALRGEQTDGHNYIREAYKKGASLIVVSEKWWQQKQVKDLPLLITADPEQALQKISKAYRNSFEHPVLCITGSNGKTTTLKMIKEVLSNRYNVNSTIGNFNNQIGVPLSILAHRDKHNFSVLELGTNHFGEIEFLACIAQPTAGLITNIGIGHVEFLKDRAGVAKAKSELFSSLPKDGIAFVNCDDKYIKKMEKPQHQISYCFNNNADYEANVINIDKNANYTIEINATHQISLSIAGESFAKNALAAFAVGSFYKIPVDKIIKTLENFTASSSRLKVINKEYKIFDDTYNANPDSTKSALNTISKIKNSGKKIFVFGDMLELGENSEKYHRKIGMYALKKGIDILFTYGDLSEVSTKTARKKGLKASHFKSKKELAEALKKIIEEEDIILIKGSRGNRMEDIVSEVT